MKRAIAVLAILVFMVILSGNHSFAQMMGGKMMGNNTSQSSMTKPQQSKKMADTNLTDLMQNSTQMSSTMMKNFSRLQTQFQADVKNDDSEQWKSDQKELQSLMATIHQEMSKQMQMNQRMMTMMQAGDMHGNMMGNNSMRQMQEKGKTSDQPNSSQNN